MNRYIKISWLIYHTNSQGENIPRMIQHMYSTTMPFLFVILHKSMPNYISQVDVQFIDTGPPS